MKMETTSQEGHSQNKLQSVKLAKQHIYAKSFSIVTG